MVYLYFFAGGLIGFLVAIVTQRRFYLPRLFKEKAMLLRRDCLLGIKSDLEEAIEKIIESIETEKEHQKKLIDIGKKLYSLPFDHPQYFMNRGLEILEIVYLMAPLKGDQIRDMKDMMGNLLSGEGKTFPNNLKDFAIFTQTLCSVERRWSEYVKGL